MQGGYEKEEMEMNKLGQRQRDFWKEVEDGENLFCVRTYLHSRLHRDPWLSECHTEGTFGSGWHIPEILSLCKVET